MRSLFLIVSLCFSLPVSGTFSIIACEPATGVCGAAVATNNLAVGASVIHVQAGIGALVSQYETHSKHGSTGLKLLANSVSPDHVLEHLLEADNNFDGGSINDRQFAFVSSRGDVRAYTGSNALRAHFAGQLQAQSVSVQGNGLQDKEVLVNMLATFQTTVGSLPTRLLAALKAGQSAGGQSSGQMSAAVLVRTPQGFPFDIDLRVDADNSPVEKLDYLLGLHQARQSIIDAKRLLNNDPIKSKQLLELALQKGATWDRVLKRAIPVAKKLDEKELELFAKARLSEIEAAKARQRR
jgi:uncharacterized Ntn-hydrolase superfamily protein